MVFLQTDCTDGAENEFLVNSFLQTGRTGGAENESLENSFLQTGRTDGAENESFAKFISTNRLHRWCWKRISQNSFLQTGRTDGAKNESLKTHFYKQDAPMVLKTNLSKLITHDSILNTLYLLNDTTGRITFY